MHDTMSRMLLVTRAASHFGRSVIEHLLKLPGTRAEDVIAVTRTPEKLTDLAGRGVEVRVADFDDERSLHGAFGGARRLLLVNPEAPDAPGRWLDQHRKALAAAVRSGVDHVTYTSMPAPFGSSFFLAPDHAGTESWLEQCGIRSWTVLRNHWHFEHLLPLLPSVLQSRRWYSAAGQGRVAHVAQSDVALAAAEVLYSAAAGQATFTLSGPRAYTASEIARLVGQVAGLPIDVVPIAADELGGVLEASGLPTPLARLYASLDENTAAGRAAVVTEDLSRLTGRRPQRFEPWLDCHRAAIRALAMGGRRQADPG